MEKLYGLERNYRGLCLDRFLYTASQLAEKDPCFPGGEPESYEGAFWGDDTYTVIRLDTEDDVLAFVKGDTNHDCGYEDPQMIDLAEWYSDFKNFCIFTYEGNPTAIGYLREKGLTDTDLSVKDDRYAELKNNGFSESFFYEDENRSRRYSEVAA